MYADVHFLGGKLVTVREVDVTTKAHQRHEGSLSVSKPAISGRGSRSVRLGGW